jgi:hypothetical protein
VADRPLTERQQTALAIAAFYGVTRSVEGRMPALERRGLVHRTWVVSGGPRYRDWEVTDAGLAEAKRLRRERVAANLRSQAKADLAAPEASGSGELPHD